MIRYRWVCVVLVFGAIAAVTNPVGAQSMVDRSRLDLGLGTRLTSSSSTSPGGVTKTTEAGGILASIGYAHWRKEELAVTFTGTLRTAKVESADSHGVGWETNKAFSVPLFLGLRRYLPTPTDLSTWRPWLSGEAGPIIGIEVASDKYGTGAGSGSRNAVGARFALGVRGGLGLDVRLSKLVTVGVASGYTLIPSFLDTGGDQSNQKGMDVGIRASLLLNQPTSRATPPPQGTR